MSDTQHDIRAWLQEQPAWLQQAADLLLSSGGVSDTDIQDLVDRLKSPEGQQVAKYRIFDGLTPAPSSDSELRLLEIGDISGIENLGPRRPLGFGTGNLCVIYGNNGSGKSGYTRLLKKACGKPRASELHPNVFLSTPSERKCTIRYEEAGVATVVVWPANSAPIDAMRVVDIFDTDAALSYLTQETGATYTPPSVALFEALAAVCGRIKTRLESEQGRLVGALPVLPVDYAMTPTGIAYGALNPDIDEAAIQRITQWRGEDTKALEQLTERLKADDPAASARTKRRTKEQIDQLGNMLRDGATALGQERLVTIRALRVDALTKRRIAAEAAQVASAKLDGIGSDTWRALWEAARLYSHTAYPGRDYPVTDEARCVLCHQELGQEAQLRLRDFEGFVQGKLETEAKAAEKAYREALDELPVALSEDAIATRVQAAGLTEDRWANRLADYFEKVGKARDTLLNGETTELATAVSQPISILDELTTRSDTLEREAEQHDRDATIFDRAQAGREKLDLEAHRWTAQQSEAIRAEVARLRKMADYETWKRAVNPRGISNKADLISEKVITEAFVKRFNRELEALGASRIRVELTKTRMERGKALHGLRLRGVQPGLDLPDSILSDGERRIVALAAFLADVVADDVVERSHVAPLVFDDPISSLDQEFEWRVALRLSQLAKNRQVLVFTHRLSLYGAMEDAAKKMGEDWKNQHLHQHCIEMFAGIAGHPMDQAAWSSSTKQANNILLARLAEAKKAGEATGAEAYRNHAQGVCSDFRKLLERTVEDDLLNQVVKRHRRSVTTENRLTSLSHITREDCRFIDDLMTKYSCYEHSQSLETPIFIPEEPELRADLESLKAWREEFKKRGKEGNAHA